MEEQDVILTAREFEELVQLISWAVNGTEQGVVTYDDWKQTCKELKEKLIQLGGRPHGQWTTV